MDHPVTISADNDEILFRVDFSFSITRCKRDHMMNLDVIFSPFSIHFFKVKTAGHTLCAMDPDRRFPITGITLISRGVILSSATFGMNFVYVLVLRFDIILHLLLNNIPITG